MVNSPLLVHEFIHDLGNDAVVLDLGCGAGSVNYRLYACRFIACDTIQRPDVSAFPPNVEFQVAPANCLPFKDGFFNAVICNWIFEHLDDPVGVLREIERISKPDAYLYISIPDAASVEDRLYRLLHKDHGGHVQRYNLAGFLRMIYANSPFKLVSFADWAGGFVYLDHLSYGPRLRSLLYATFQCIKRLTGRRIPARSNYIFLFRRGAGAGFREFTHTCNFCGCGHQLPDSYAEAVWTCLSCGRKNPYL